jgi:hypothetical protein
VLNDHLRSHFYSRRPSSSVLCAVLHCDCVACVYESTGFLLVLCCSKLQRVLGFSPGGGGVTPLQTVFKAEAFSQIYQNNGIYV